ncbi:hypothetical protein [Streptomyces sp. NPDC059010]|uniref:hypothetical protein n=1 Tax=Streptomyces sp. NPDC059010 TaxID=3346695 RepID=UPI003687380D
MRPRRRTLFQNAQNVAAAQRQVSEDPASTSGMASSGLKALGPLKVSIGDDDMPTAGELSKITDNRRHFALITTVADWSGARLLAVDLAAGTSRTVAGVNGAYGVALDGAGKAYVANWTDGQLIAVDLASGQKTTVDGTLGGGISAVALDGKGKAYVGQKDGAGKLFEVDLTARTHRVVTSVPGASTIRVELDGAGKAFTIDHLNGRLYDISLADGGYRVVATGLGTCEGLALDTVAGQIYVSNREGQLWQIDKRATEVLGGVGKVMG